MIIVLILHSYVFLLIYINLIVLSALEMTVNILLSTIQI